ncbi:MAG TPA: DUF222 domain-containing protein [Acidimicrobiia bacterium]|nr:DUF222 domain-containing protein [Acidimicrobiia bacterium]
MFESWDGKNWGEKVDELERRVLAKEAEISRLRAEQATDLQILDQLQVDLGDGDRCMDEWVQAHLDVSHQTAARLLQVARSSDRATVEKMKAGLWGLDRASLLLRLAQAGAIAEQVADAADNYSLGRIYGLILELKEISPLQEQASFEDRYLVIQPNLDSSMYKLWGQIHGVDGQIVDEVLRKRASTFPNIPDQSQGQLLADALTDVCLDSLTGGSESEQPGRPVVVAEVFVDATVAAPTQGEAGATTSSGLRVGPNTLAEILCNGSARVIYSDCNGPFAVSHRTETISPAIRAFVLKRDQGRCSIEGCGSRHRLQPHHIKEQHDDIDHDPDNLITLCWYHHHVAILQLGFTIDPYSPPHRRRLIGWRPINGPPVRLAKSA